eukprot:TRINITY_DN23742_c0_g1_i2.p2 TRINITY_DN23742_c0_g1~~TRINITY_DN23742_c0_g1_i2.p2  ORF type:complete len:117 (+),score=22.39 TRINITY_DN23742_c0_g1_i2:155-505(+)
MCIRDSSRTVKKETSPNLGRYFWVCSKPQGEQCNFFEWYEDPAEKAAAGQMPAVLCLCLRPGTQRTVMKQDSPNKGKKFWVCANPREKQCGFFEWVEVPESTPSGAPPSGSHAPGF